MRKLGIDYTLAARWARRWRWTERVRAWDDHLLLAIDRLGLSAQIRVREQQLATGLAMMRTGESAAKQADTSKIGAEGIVALAESGASVARQAVDLTETKRNASSSPIGVAVSVNGWAPAWAPQSSFTNPARHPVEGSTAVGALSSHLQPHSAKLDSRSEASLEEKIDAHNKAKQNETDETDETES
jgi:hypothetical protein